MPWGQESALQQVSGYHKLVTSGDGEEDSRQFEKLSRELVQLS